MLVRSYSPLFFTFQYSLSLPLPPLPPFYPYSVNTPPHAIIEDVSQITDALVAELGGFNVTYADVPTTPISLSTLSASLPPTRIPIGGGLFVKPEHGYDSVGIDEGSRVFNMQQLKERCAKV